MGGIKNLIIIRGDCGDEYWFVKYAVEIGDLPLFSSRNLCKNKGYRIIGEKQCYSVNKRILFEITPMQSVNPRIAALFYASAMKVLKVRPMVRRKKWFHSQISATTTTRYYDDFFVTSKTNLSWLENLVRLSMLPFDKIALLLVLFRCELLGKCIHFYYISMVI